MRSGAAAPIQLAQTQNGRKGFVDAPLLVWCHSSHQIAKSSSVDGADLLDKHAGGIAQQFYLRAERCWPGAEGRRRDQDHRSRKQLVGLDDHAVPSVALLMTRSPRRAEFVDVTPQHACSP